MDINYSMEIVPKTKDDSKQMAIVPFTINQKNDCPYYWYKTLVKKVMDNLVLKPVVVTNANAESAFQLQYKRDDGKIVDLLVRTPPLYVKVANVHGVGISPPDGITNYQKRNYKLVLTLIQDQEILSKYPGLADEQESFRNAMENILLPAIQKITYDCKDMKSQLKLTTITNLEKSPLLEKMTPEDKKAFVEGTAFINWNTGLNYWGFLGGTTSDGTVMPADYPRGSVYRLSQTVFFPKKEANNVQSNTKNAPKQLPIKKQLEERIEETPTNIKKGLTEIPKDEKASDYTLYDNLYYKNEVDNFNNENELSPEEIWKIYHSVMSRGEHTYNKIKYAGPDGKLLDLGDLAKDITHKVINPGDLCENTYRVYIYCNSTSYGCKLQMTGEPIVIVKKGNNNNTQRHGYYGSSSVLNQYTNEDVPKITFPDETGTVSGNFEMKI